jgi:hypothetical protein
MPALDLSCSADKFGKIWSVCGQHEIQCAEWRMNNYTYNFPCVFFYTALEIKIFLQQK